MDDRQMLREELTGLKSELSNLKLKIDTLEQKINNVDNITFYTVSDLIRL